MDRRDFLTAGKAKKPAPVNPIVPMAIGTSPTRTLSGINPYTGPWTTNEVIHLLKRTMFGAKKTDVDYFASRTMNQTVDELLNPTAPNPAPPVKEYVTSTILGVNADTNIAEDEMELLEILTNSEKLKGRYAELNSYYYLGIANIKIDLTEKAEKYFDTLVSLKTDISKMTIAKDFLRPIGELFEEKQNISKALFWYKKAIEFSPTIGLKKKITQLEKIPNL